MNANFFLISIGNVGFGYVWGQVYFLLPNSSFQHFADIDQCHPVSPLTRDTIFRTLAARPAHIILMETD